MSLATINFFLSIALTVITNASFTEFSKSYRDNTDPGHKAAMDKMDKLFKTAYPGP